MKLHMHSGCNPEIMTFSECSGLTTKNSGRMPHTCPLAWVLFCKAKSEAVLKSSAFYPLKLDHLTRLRLSKGTFMAI